METSGVSRLPSTPANPLDLFLLFLSALPSETIPMNLATIDPYEGVMSRTVMFQGLENDAFRLITEKSSTKYENIKNDPRVALTFAMNTEIDGKTVYRQVRVNGVARELSASVVSSYWPNEPLYAKIRSHICDCQTAQSWDTIKINHDNLLKDYLFGKDPLDQTRTYTVLEIKPRRIEFYQSSSSEISDRVIYKKYRKDYSEKWRMDRVCC